MKGQASIMEYMIFVLLVMFIIFFLVAMIFGSQILSAGTERSKAFDETSMLVLQRMSVSYILNEPGYQKGSMLDDSKLAVITCEDIESVFGYDLWVEVRMLYDKPDCSGLLGIAFFNCDNERKGIISKENLVCSQSNYPECGIWRYCEKKPRMVYRSIPVNIHRKINGTISLGSLTVGVRGESG